MPTSNPMLTGIYIKKQKNNLEMDVFMKAQVHSGINPDPVVAFCLS